jgi:HEAT repeat protein
MRTFLCVAVLSPGIAFSQTPASSALDRDRAHNLLDNSLKDKNPDTRKHAVQSLSLLTPSDSNFSQLAAMLEDKDVEVRLAAVASLVDFDDKRTVPVLRRALDSDVPEVSFAAAKALWTLNEPSGREALVSVLSGETKTSSGFITRQKRDALRMLHTPTVMFIFAMKTGAIFAPVPGLGAGISSLQGILSDPGVTGRAATALLLSLDKSAEVLQALQDALDDSDWSVRAAAVHAIAIRNDPALENDLLPLFEDKKEAVRVRAAAGYLRLEAIKVSPIKSARRHPPNKVLPVRNASRNQ